MPFSTSTRRDASGSSSLPVEALFTQTVLSYGAVFYLYNKWRKTGEWKELWLTLLDKHRREFDMSSVDLDGSHTTALRGGEECGYQGRKKRKKTNALYLTDRQGLPLMMSYPKSGEHNDIHDIESVMENMFSDLEKANIRTQGFSSTPMRDSTAMCSEDCLNVRKWLLIYVSANAGLILTVFSLTTNSMPKGILLKG